MQDEAKVTTAYLAKKLPMNSTMIRVMILMLALASCNRVAEKRTAEPDRGGVVKDPATGLVASYSLMEPEQVYLVMNGEILNHNDVPIGETFAVYVKNVKGLQIRDGKISLGCFLTLEDTAGKKLMEEPDLFAGNEIFNAADTSLLRCSITTSELMQWEEKYKVTVVFWDKYGEGKIENTVTIRAIDIP